MIVGIRIAPMRNERRVRNSMQVSPIVVATARVISPRIPVSDVMIMIRKIRIVAEIFV